MSGADKMAGYQAVRAPRGAVLSCKGWKQEAVLRMLLNSLDPEVAERPQDLIVSGSIGPAAADWESVHSIVASLRRMEDDESLFVESGRPVEVRQTAARSPRVLATNAAGAEPLGNWLYAGTQTTLPVLYEIYGEAARRHFGGTLAGKLVAGGGMGGAGGAQPLAAALHGAAFLGIDSDAERIKRRVKSGYCEVMVNNLDEALRMLKNAVRQRKSASIGLIGDCGEIFSELARRGVVPDVLTDGTPSPCSTAQAQAKRDLENLGTRVIELSDCSQETAGIADGWRLATWLALSGERADITRMDQLARELFVGEERVWRWIDIAGKYVRFQGLPARVAWLPEREPARFGQAMNEVVARGETSAPILLGYHSAAAKSSAADGNTVPDGSCWAWTGGAAALSARAIVADGTADAAERLSQWPGS